MENIKSIFAVIAAALIIGVLFFFLLAVVEKSNDQAKKKKMLILQKEFEKIYFEGQRDALEGDVRIYKTPSGCYIWSKSPWDTGELPIFNPSDSCLVKK